MYFLYYLLRYGEDYKLLVHLPNIALVCIAFRGAYYGRSAQYSKEPGFHTHLAVPCLHSKRCVLESMSLFGTTQCRACVCVSIQVLGGSITERTLSFCGRGMPRGE